MEWFSIKNINFSKGVMGEQLGNSMAQIYWMILK